MHSTVMDFVQQALSATDVAGRNVLEVGSYDVNGSVRPYVLTLDPHQYLGVDQSEGPGVDMVADCVELVSTFGRSSFDVVISTEMLEHVEDWKASIQALVEVVQPGGLLVITTRSPGFQYHPYPDDFWRYTVAQMGDIITRAGLEVIMLEADPHPGVFVKARKPAGWASPFSVGDPWADIHPTAPVR